MKRNYESQVLELGRHLATHRGPGASIATVYHDDWCLQLNHKGPCNCNPEVRVTHMILPCITCKKSFILPFAEENQKYIICPDCNK
jgi:DNA-directed RNA polymerase subunit RPC12/RpoP